MKKNLKKCEICNENVEELYETDSGKNACGNCFAAEFSETFNEDEDDTLFENALKSGKVKVMQPKTKPVTIRLNIFDIKMAKKRAKEENMPYQTYLKQVIHKNLA